LQLVIDLLNAVYAQRLAVFTLLAIISRCAIRKMSKLHMLMYYEFNEFDDGVCLLISGLYIAWLVITLKAILSGALI